MKPEELFVGAWVYNAHHKKNIQITPYDFFTHRHDENGVQHLQHNSIPRSGMDLYPIPITPEILKKNGWVIDKENEVVSRFVWAQKPPKNKLEFTTVEISLYNEASIGVKCLVEIRCSSLSNGINSFHSCDCENIHQLQAALRLCKIEKEIVP